MAQGKMCPATALQSLKDRQKSRPVETLSVSGLTPMTVRQRWCPYMVITSWGKSTMSGPSLQALFNLFLQEVWALFGIPMII